MKCEIRRWKISDAQDLVNAISNKKVLDNLRDGIPYPYTESDAKEFIEMMLKSDPDQDFYWAIVVDDKVIGSIGAFRQDNVHCRTAEMGYYIAEEYWGRGIMVDAVKQACKWIFDETDVVRIFAEPFGYNTASCRVLEKAGFELEGVLRQGVFKNGKIIDMRMYSLIKEEV